MALLPNVFNPNQAGQERMNDYTPVPAGVYVGVIEKSEMKVASSNSNHKHLDFQIKILQVIDVPGSNPADHPSYVGKMCFSLLNLVNSSEKTVAIAYKELASICDACCIQQGIAETTPLHGIPMLITVVVKPADAQYAAKNIIRKYEKYGSTAVADPAMVAAATIAPAVVQPVAAVAAVQPVVVAPMVATVQPPTQVIPTTTNVPVVAQTAVVASVAMAQPTLPVAAIPIPSNVAPVVQAIPPVPETPPAPIPPNADGTEKTAPWVKQ